jgi:hypothetical protein
VGHRADQAAGGPHGEPGVGIQGDDEADILRHLGRAAVDGHERRVPSAAQQPVQLVELSPLSLPADPFAFLRVPEPPPVQQQETLSAIGRGPVSRVELRDAVGQRGEKLLVARHPLGGGVRPVREQGEVEVAFGIGQIVHQDPLELTLDVLLTREHGRHGDHRPELRGNALGKLELGKQARRHEEGDQPVNDRHGQVGDGHQAEDPQNGQSP